MGTKLARRSLFQGIGAVVFAKALERLPVQPASHLRHLLPKWVLEFDELARTSSIVTLEPGDTVSWVRDAVGGYAFVLAVASAVISSDSPARSAASGRL